MLRNCLLLIPACAGLALFACGSKAEPPRPAAAPQPNIEELARRPLAEPPRPGLWITEPVADARVAYRPAFTGTISDTNARSVWLIVRAVGMPDYWVQPTVAVRNDGFWICQPYIGLADTRAGVRFEVRAVADPAEPLQPSTKLAAWPQARYSSNTVVVSR
jgi:hypothetical protein